MKTFTELERSAYMAGNTKLAEGFYAIEDLLNDADLTLSRDIDEQLDEKIEKAVSSNCPDYEAYKRFFEDCFERLNGHYPCPSVTSDYDKSIIFQAIERGEGIEE